VIVSRWSRTKALAGLVLVVSGATAIAAIVVSVRRATAYHEAARLIIAAPESLPASYAVVAAGPIRNEAEVFRTSPAALAIDPSGHDRRAAHPRTLATYRLLRAYPGAPPRIPHGLTPAETRRGGCKTCHERGGYSQRFGAYVPITPHPDFGECLQCHVGDAQLMANPLPSSDPNARCRQCHAPGSRRWRDSSLAWEPMAWPAVTARSAGDPPPPIPHDLDLRGNCLACHSAPSAVAEIRTPHPERANCRQCHVEAGRASEDFVRSASAPTRARGKS
jgi:cytochrome c-type protein NapB